MRLFFSVIDWRLLNPAIVCTRRVFVHVNRFHVLFIPSLLIYLQNLPAPLCSITLASNIQWMYKISQRENIQGISNDSWRKNIRGKKSDICCIIHPKIRGGLWGYRRQHHDTKWNIYSRRDHLIQSNMYVYIRATNPTTLALFTIHLGRFLALVYPYFG